jgi:hypothetical protein
MKKIAFLAILIFIIGIMFSCNDSSSGDDVAVGYIDPALGTPKDISGNKSYNLTMTTGGNKTLSGSIAHAIIYEGSLNGVSYVGIAVDNFDNTPSTDRFKLQIYWSGYTIATTPFPLTSTQYSVNLIINGVQYTTPTGNLDLTITAETDNTYSIEFTGNNISITGNSIADANLVGPGIRAQKY